MKSMIGILLFLGAFGTHSATIIIEGQPTALEYRDNVYYPPSTYVYDPEITYMYVTMNGIPKICLINQQAPLYLEQVSQINIIIKGWKTMWNCYAYNTSIIEVKP